MESTWRWFGPHDPIGIGEVAQTGVTGVVSALHHVPAGQIWTSDEIRKRQAEITYADAGTATNLTWRVVESLVVSETIKSGKGPVAEHLAAYCASLENLASCGVRIVAYNFMPVLDWTRTDDAYPIGFDGLTLSFDYIDLAVFDIFILARPGAEEDYSPAVIERATERFKAMSEDEAQRLASNIVKGFPGANQSLDMKGLRDQLVLYRDVDRAALRANLDRFLNAVLPTAERLGVTLCVHPDDPPFDVLGLPRILSTPADFRELRAISTSQSNGITFCTGSLGVARGFDGEAFVREFGPAIHFAHLRNTIRQEVFEGQAASFFESGHLRGDTDMIAVVKALLDEEKKGRQIGYRPDSLPMRPDHGIAMFSDTAKQMQPGYPLIGRLHGLAELRGIEAALSGERIPGIHTNLHE